jgi:hypothetical protein
MKHSSITWSSEPSLSKSPQYRSKSKPTASSLVSYSQIYQEQRRVPRIEDHKSASAMSHGHQSGVRSTSPRGSPSITGKESSTTKSEEWSDVRDPSERRKIQNKLAQRRFRRSTPSRGNFRGRANVCQATKLKNKRKKPTGKARTNEKLVAHMHLQNQKIFKTAKTSPVFHGEGFL